MANRLKSFKVLIVEDDRLMLKLVADILSKLGFGEIHKATTGRAGLSIMDSTAIDILICDWRMPGMDGIELTKIIRAAEKSYKLVPIIMLTGNAEQQHVVEARDAGVTEYLIKPFTVKDLCSRLNEIVEKPREFVLAPVYTGPSRRRKEANPPSGERRKRRKSSARPTHGKR